MSKNYVLYFATVIKRVDGNSFFIELVNLKAERFLNLHGFCKICRDFVKFVEKFVYL